MNIASIVLTASQSGRTIAVVGQDLHIRPRLTDEVLRQRIVTNKPEIVAFLTSFDVPLAVAHRFTVTAVADREDVRTHGVCLSCGIPWSIHGEPPESSWLLVEYPDDARLIRASPLEIAAAEDRSVA